MTVPMAREVGPDGIRVLSIAPGPIKTEMHDKLDAQMLEKSGGDNIYSDLHKIMINEHTPIRRLGLLDEFASFAEHCIENEYLNGTTIRFDGGMRHA